MRSLERERERERETDRKRERERERQTESEKERERETDRQTDRDREIDRKKERCDRLIKRTLAMFLLWRERKNTNNEFTQSKIKSNYFSSRSCNVIFVRNIFLLKLSNEFCKNRIK